MKTAKLKNHLQAMVLCIALAGVSALEAKAQIIVGQCASGKQFSTIQAAVNAAPSGATIRVCPGGYPEQVTIEKPLTIQGMIAQGTEGALIIPPSGGLQPIDATGYSPQILVTNTTGVTISNLIVDAANNNATNCDSSVTGILFHNASGTAQKVAVRNQVGQSNCSGFGLYARDDNQSTQTVTVQNSEFRNQATWAVTGEGLGLTFNVLNNFVSGPDNWPYITIGIVYFGAPSGTVQGNIVVNEATTNPALDAPTQNSAGIAVVCSNASITGNTISDTQLGIYIGCLNSGFPSNETVTQNKIFDTKIGHGIYIYSDGNSVTNNVIVGSSSAGILIDSALQAAGNTVSGNTITEACVGVDLTGAMGTNKLSNNTFNAVNISTQKNAVSCGLHF